MRTIALPVDIDVERIEAELKDGILSVVLPKIRAAERHTAKVAESDCSKYDMAGATASRPGFFLTRTHCRRAFRPET